jgi:predicted RNA-binding protein Jag
MRQEARVRARVRPTTPPPKVDRRDRRRRSGGRDREQGREREREKAPAGGGGGRGGGRTRGGRKAGADDAPARESAAVSDTAPDDDVEPATVAEVGEAASGFVRGLVEAFGVEATTSVAELDEDTLEVRVEGADLGLLTVLESGKATAMEPLNAADRKVVHDAANAIDGIRTTSEGEEPRRRVVLHADEVSE